ncbi:MAG: hypothetical protein RLZZ69_1422 [Cyanobacteriota bacterium]
MSANLKFNIKVNPGYLADQVVKSGLYERYSDALLDIAEEFQVNSPVGATRQLKSSWDVQNSPKAVAWGFEVRSNIINTSDRALNRIAGRPSGTPPPVEPLINWVKAKGIESDTKKAKGVAFAIAKKIAKKGTDRHVAKKNWVGIDDKGNRISGGRLEELEEALAAKLS